jgi:magnesium-transporting ATPase (P-type)
MAYRYRPEAPREVFESMMEAINEHRRETEARCRGEVQLPTATTEPEEKQPAVGPSILARGVCIAMALVALVVGGFLLMLGFGAMSGTEIVNEDTAKRVMTLCFAVFFLGPVFYGGGILLLTKILLAKDQRNWAGIVSTALFLVPLLASLTEPKIFKIVMSREPLFREVQIAYLVFLMFFGYLYYRCRKEIGQARVSHPISE